MIAPERAREAIAEKHGDEVAVSVLTILDGLGLAVRQRQPGDKRWATTARRLQRDPEFAERHAATKRRDRHRAQNATVDGAGRRGLPWTGPELELVARTDLTVDQVAQMTGRTHYGVEMQRRKLRDDPRKLSLAGVRVGAGGGES